MPLFNRQKPITTADIAPDAVKLPIGKDEIAKAEEIREKYAQGKKSLEAKIAANFEWYRLRQWDQMRTTDTTGVNPSSAWLFNCIANKHADAMDNFPAPNILPREETDRDEAKKLSAIIPCILDQDDWEETYDYASWYKLVAGTVCYGVYWIAAKDNGLGNVGVRVVDILNLYWEPGITDIQHSKNVYVVELRDNEDLIAQYPQLEGKLGSDASQVTKYRMDDTIDTSEKSRVIDWYYKKTVGTRTVLHYVKYVNDEVLYATENQPETAQTGLYDDGNYPFVIDTLFPLPGQLAGFGYIDLGRSPQEYIDRLSQAIMQNGLANTRPRFFVRSSGNINEQEFSDYTKDLVHVEGNIDGSIIPIEGKPLAGIYVDIQQRKIDELKETTGTRDVATGGTTSGVTAASAIAAMQEAGSKLSRDDNKSTYRAFRKIVSMIIERIRQFYSFPHAFRILNERGAMEFTLYTNAAIRAQAQGNAFGVDLSYRVPLFDVEISAEKKSPYSRMSQNELALQFFGAGFFNPALSDQALMALDMMDFDRKSFVMEKIAQQGAMYQQAMAMSAAMGMPPMGAEPVPEGGGAQMPQEPEHVGESASTRKARQRVAESTSPT